MTATETHLKPCPFCGGHGYIGHDLARTYCDLETDEDGDLHISISDNGWYYVYCINCDAKGPKVKGPVNWTIRPETTRKKVAETIDKWNRRAK